MNIHRFAPQPAVPRPLKLLPKELRPLHAEDLPPLVDYMEIVKRYFVRVSDHEVFCFVDMVYLMSAGGCSMLTRTGSKWTLAGF